jgi:hypothetical protein
MVESKLLRRLLTSWKKREKEKDQVPRACLHMTRRF